MILPLYNDFRMDDSDVPTHPALVEQFEDVRRCQESRGVDQCSACMFFNDCDRIKTYLRWVELFKRSGAKSEG